MTPTFISVYSWAAVKVWQDVQIFAAAGKSPRWWPAVRPKVAESTDWTQHPDGSAEPLFILVSHHTSAFLLASCWVYPAPLYRTEWLAMERGAILWSILNWSQAAYEMWKRLCSLWVFTTILTTLILINSIMTSRCLCLQLFFSGLPVIIKDRYIYEKIF